jgi:hypothetical protein
MPLRNSVYVKVCDLREVGAMPESEIGERRVCITTDQQIIKLCASETTVCQLLLALQKTRGVCNTRVVFFDMYGNRYNWIRPGDRVAHFALWPGFGDSAKSSPAVSYMHEDAIEYASRLIMANKLKTRTLCSHGSHVPVLPQHKWALNDIRCFETLAVDGLGEGLTTALSYYWHPDKQNHPKLYFNIDYAVLKDGKLHIAVEIQRTHENSTSKYESFLKYGIKNVQLEANEIVKVCASRDWDDPNAPEVVVYNHPVSVRNAIRCEPCLQIIEEEAKQRALTAAREEALRCVRHSAEFHQLTKYSNPVVNRWLKGFVWNFKLPDNSIYASATIYQSAYDANLNRDPSFIRVVTKNPDIINRLQRSNHKPVCVFLANIQPDRASRFMTFLNLDEHLIEGVNLLVDMDAIIYSNPTPSQLLALEDLRSEQEEMRRAIAVAKEARRLAEVRAEARRAAARELQEEQRKAEAIQAEKTRQRLKEVEAQRRAEAERAKHEQLQREAEAEAERVRIARENEKKRIALEDEKKRIALENEKKRIALEREKKRIAQENEIKRKAADAANQAKRERELEKNRRIAEEAAEQRELAKRQRMEEERAEREEDMEREKCAAAMRKVQKTTAAKSLADRVTTIRKAQRDHVSTKTLTKLQFSMSRWLRG